MSSDTFTHHILRYVVCLVTCHLAGAGHTVQKVPQVNSVCDFETDRGATVVANDFIALAQLDMHIWERSLLNDGAALRSSRLRAPGHHSLDMDQNLTVGDAGRRGNLTTALGRADPLPSWHERLGFPRLLWPAATNPRGHPLPSRFSPQVHHILTGPRDFFEAAEFFEWILLGCFAIIGVVLHYFVMHLPNESRFHSLVLVVWLLLGAIYWLVIWLRLGRQAGLNWLTGYLLELIFSVENIFVFHIVIRAFRMPRRHAQKALFFVVCFQILFEMIFFMGLAPVIRKLKFLPYVLGLWLLYVGYQAAFEDEHKESDIRDTWVYKITLSIFGDRLDHRYDPSVSVVTRGEGGTLAVTMLFPATISLLVIDFLLEVDVPLTKIEFIQDHYLAFSSSVAAVFAIPELFFVCRDLFARFFLLKYGVTFIIVFFGAEMLLHTLVTITPLMSCFITIAVCGLCIIVSALYKMGASDLDADVEDETFKRSQDAKIVF